MRKLLGGTMKKKSIFRTLLETFTPLGESKDTVEKKDNTFETDNTNQKSLNNISEQSEIFFENIVNLYRSEKNRNLNFSDGLDAVSSELDTGISLCNEMIDKILSFDNKDALCETLRNHSTEGRISLTREVSDIELTIFSFYKDKDLIDSLAKKFDDISKKYQRMKEKIKTEKQFVSDLALIPKAPIRISESENIALDVSDLMSIHYTGITKKTNYERLGNFVSIDVETTGLSCQRDQIIEVSAIYFEYWDPVKIFSTLVNSECDIPEKISQLTGITQDMTNHAPTFNQIAYDLSEFIGKNNIVGHNIEFDLKFLYKFGIDFISTKRKYYDTLQISKTTLKSASYKRPDADYDVENYKLSTLCEFYGINGNLGSHRSDYDALSTGYLLKKLANDKIDM